MQYWELVHALTMIPGFVFKNWYYRLFCSCSITYHCFRGFFPNKDKYINKLLHIDLLSQLIACLFTANELNRKAIIFIPILLSFMINVKQQKYQQLAMNGVSIFVSNNNPEAVYNWVGVMSLCVMYNLTKNEWIHSLMHLMAHWAYRKSL